MQDWPSEEGWLSSLDERGAWSGLGWAAPEAIVEEWSGHQVQGQCRGGSSEFARFQEMSVENQ